MRYSCIRCGEATVELEGEGWHWVCDRCNGMVMNCPTCDGEGYVPDGLSTDKRCGRCHGKGTVRLDAAPPALSSVFSVSGVEDAGSGAADPPSSAPTTTGTGDGRPPHDGDAA